jgi:rhodanese-related sulfurtransferase
MSFDELPPREAQLRVSAGAPYLDVRSVQEFEEGHPEGAYNIPILFAGPGGMRPNPAFVDAVRAHFAPTADLVIGCRSGGRSARACELLRDAGFTGQLTNVAGGFEGAPGVRGWASEGLPSSRDSAGRAWSDLADG